MNLMTTTHVTLHSELNSIDLASYITIYYNAEPVTNQNGTQTNSDTLKTHFIVNESLLL